MAQIRNTKFGYLEPILVRDGETVSELAMFDSNGKNHKHDKCETCFVLSGYGTINIDYLHNLTHHKVKKGDIITIPANTGHWMQVEKGHVMEILIVYS